MSDSEARPETIFPLFTDPAKLTRWKGRSATLDPRPGGTYLADINGSNMPTFVDHHPTAPMSPEMAQAAVEKLKSGQADEFGVTGINAFVGEKDTRCITESDSAESVHKSHEAIGITLGEGDVTEVNSFVPV